MATAAGVEIVRFEIRPTQGAQDSRAVALARAAGLLGSARVTHSHVYLVEGSLSTAQCNQIARELLADPVTQQWSWQRHGGTATGHALFGTPDATVEVHPLPGVMDPAAESVRTTIGALTGERVDVRTGSRYDFWGVPAETARRAVEAHVANGVIHAVKGAPYHPEALPRGHAYSLVVRNVPLRGLDAGALERLSREAHLFLSLEEMQAIQAEFVRLGREPREIELETLAQTWSEHCVHKTLKSRIRYRGTTCGTHARPGHEAQAIDAVVIENLLKTTVAAATHELTGGAALTDGPGVDLGAEPIDWCLSVFVDNSGVIAFDDDHAVCFKVETHNHPSAIEPYGGAATGIGGCIRDVIGTGQGARPIAATDIFCVANPGMTSVPRGCLPPKRVLSQVVAGIRDYGNRMGIPTLNGTVWFDDRFVGNPLVFAGCVGLMPRERVRGSVRAGDRIIALGGRTGRDGIHGATFSSAELSDTHAEEFSHAVQIGNAITEKSVLDAIIAARDHASGCLYNGLTDCGAGGFSSAVGEMGATLGAEVHLDGAPTKYDGLSPTEVWISEAQERMVLAVPEASVAALRTICADHAVEFADLGVFGTPDRHIVLRWHGSEVGRLDTEFLHNGIPTPVREAVWDPEWAKANARARVSGLRLTRPTPALGDGLKLLLAHPNIASKAWIVRQYDHEVQGTSVVKPLVGLGAGGPGDAAVIAPLARSTRGLALGCGLATGLARDPFIMGLAAVDECVRNLVCVGADPCRIAILDNFCWPSCKDPRNLGALVRAAWACYDAAKAYRVPFISGKDSLNNQFVTEDGRTIQIPPTLLISGMGIVSDIGRCCTMDLKAVGSALLVVGATSGRLGGSHWAMIEGIDDSELPLPEVDLVAGPRAARAVAELIAAGMVRSAHDPSEGGVLTAVAEMAFAGGTGARIDLALLGKASTDGELRALAFCEDPSRYVLEVTADRVSACQSSLRAAGVPSVVVGVTHEAPTLCVMNGSEQVACESLSVLREAWASGDHGW